MKLTPVPPIVMADGRMFGSVDALLGYFCFPTDVSDVGVAHDATGRRVSLAAESDDDPIVLSIEPEARPDELEAQLRSYVADQPIRYGLLDAGASLHGLLRALWTEQHREPFPGDIERR